MEIVGSNAVPLLEVNYVRSLGYLVSSWVQRCAYGVVFLIVARDIFRPEKVENKLRGRQKKVLKDRVGREGQ
jgi:hypothetical protein